MSERPKRTFSREFKLKAIKRMEAGENVVALARELNTKRRNLYRWREIFLAGGADALTRKGGRPKKKLQARDRWREDMSSVQSRRHFTQEFKVQVVKRIESRETIFSLACELKIKPGLLYRWRDRFRTGGEEALRSKGGRPRKNDLLLVVEVGAPPTKGIDPTRRSPEVDVSSEARQRRSRRLWSAKDKARIVVESYGASVNEIAERYGLWKTQVFRWRREVREAMRGGPPVNMDKLDEPALQLWQSDDSVLEGVLRRGRAASIVSE